MSIQNGPEGAILVDLPEESALEEDLDEVVRLVRNLVACDVVMDFAQVTVFDSSCLAALLRLRHHLQARGGRLVLCNVGARTSSVMAVTGLSGIFETTGSKEDALALLRGPAATPHP